MMKTLERRLGLIVAGAFIVSALIVGSAAIYAAHEGAKPQTSNLWHWLFNPEKGHGNTKVA